MRMVHWSDDHTPPHTTDHFMKNIYEQGEGDRRYTNDILFAGNVENADLLNEEIGREWAHYYDVPKNLISPETYADDDRPNESLPHIKGPQLELTHDLPALRGDAVRGNRVIKFVNAIEAPGSLSYIIPKSRIQSGDIQYRGMRSVGDDPNAIKQPDQYWEEFP